MFTFTDEEWNKVLAEIIPEGKMISIDELDSREKEAREVGKMLLEASANFALFANPNPMGAIYTLARAHETEPGVIGKFAFNFALGSNKLLQEIGVTGFRASNGS